ncbi:NAD(P)/FAD-dependent oxidoreductase [Mesonia maritima]|uniref:Squalene epoxidase domain-containing protein n=1 Tax=Mesonia maritima TaxID=1793873 RepID=A0ABU1K7L9_9FLAO|nr:FAD-dependent oxidoreductase [Mesonia maritima]MDR6301609.1 hypothetical protein [Mesonia maritima]
MRKPEIIIIGGGLAGLTAAIHLARENFKVTLFEKETYPKHKVCGEYISNEIQPYFESLEFDIFELQPKKINRFLFSTQSGKTVEATLPLGGLGISRFSLDYFLFQKALENNVTILQENVINLTFVNNFFQIETHTGNKYEAPIVLGAFGKRSNLDKEFKRDFIQQKSSWLAVKAHYQHSEFPANRVELHNFKGGYCGLSKTENEAVNVCYLTTYSSFKNYKNTTEFKENVLMKNPHLYSFFKNSKCLFEKELTIAQISFDSKTQVENHVLMLGDAAGLIHPLCGNGMAMAIHSAKLAVESILLSTENNQFNRKSLEKSYQKKWQKQFKKRMQTGNILQKVLLRPTLAEVSQNLMHNFPSLLSKIIKQTHGKPIQ